jgi:hypothetical protein
MATRKLAMAPLADFEKVDPKVCSVCGHACVRGDMSSVANFGVTREPHFVTSYGWMQVKYERATAIDCYMCLQCGHIEFYGRSPLAVLDPIERQQHLRASEPELDRKMRVEEKRRKEKQPKGQPLDSDDHVGV